MEILNIILSKLCFCFTSSAEDESSPRPWSNMPRQYQHHSFPRRSDPSQRDFISLRDHRSPIFKGERHQDVNFDDRYSNIGSRTSAFVTPEGRWTNNVGEDYLRSRSRCGNDLGNASANVPLGWIPMFEI
jgi:hypothetical protein